MSSTTRRSSRSPGRPAASGAPFAQHTHHLRHQRPTEVVAARRVHPSQRHVAGGPIAGLSVSICSAASETSSAGRRYSHNPYASSPASCSSVNTDRSGDVAGMAAHRVVHRRAARAAGVGTTPVPATIKAAPAALPHGKKQTAPAARPCVGGSASPPGPGAEQAAAAVRGSAAFRALIGGIAAAARSSTGSQVILSALQLDSSSQPIIYQELLPELGVCLMDVHGCQVVRALITRLSMEQLEGLIPCLRDDVVVKAATHSQHTRSVVQAIFSQHRTEMLTPVVQLLAQQSQRISVTQQGCIAVIHVMEHSLPHQRDMLVHRLLPSLLELVCDPYGNYVVQAICRNVDVRLLSTVLAAFHGSWVFLSCNKFASNVMEKIVWQAERVDRASYIFSEVVYVASNLRAMMQDGYGNFVVQAIIASCDNVEEFYVLQERTHPLLSGSPFGHNIYAKLQSKHLQLMGTAPMRSLPPPYL